MHTEELMRQKLDGTFREWQPNKGEFVTRSVPVDYMPRHSCENGNHARVGATAKKSTVITQECQAEAERHAKDGMGMTRAAMKLSIRHNIAIATAQRAMRVARERLSK